MSNLIDKHIYKEYPNTFITFCMELLERKEYEKLKQFDWVDIKSTPSLYERLSTHFIDRGKHFVFDEITQNDVVDFLIKRKDIKNLTKVFEQKTLFRLNESLEKHKNDLNNLYFNLPIDNDSSKLFKELFSPFYYFMNQASTNAILEKKSNSFSRAQLFYKNEVLIEKDFLIINDFRTGMFQKIKNYTDDVQKMLVSLWSHPLCQNTFENTFIKPEEENLSLVNFLDTSVCPVIAKKFMDAGLLTKQKIVNYEKTKLSPVPGYFQCLMYKGKEIIPASEINSGGLYIKDLKITHNSYLLQSCFDEHMTSIKSFTDSDFTTHKHIHAFEMDEATKQTLMKSEALLGTTVISIDKNKNKIKTNTIVGMFLSFNTDINQRELLSYRTAQEIEVLLNDTDNLLSNKLILNSDQSFISRLEAAQVFLRSCKLDASLEIKEVDRKRQPKI